MNSNNKKVNPFCVKHPGIFIEFTGLVAPCCWLVSTKHRHDRLEQFLGEDYKRIFITNSKEDIIEVYNKIKDSFDTDEPFQTCLDVCGTDSPKHPFVRKVQKQGKD